MLFYHDKGDVWLAIAKEGEVCEWFCYIIMDFATAASQNQVCIIQKRCLIMNDLFPRLLYDNKVFQNLVLFLSFSDFL